MSDELLNSIVTWIQKLDIQQATYVVGASLAIVVGLIVVPEIINWYYFWSLKKDIKSIKSSLSNLEDKILNPTESTFTLKKSEKLATLNNTQESGKTVFPFQH